MVQSFRQDQNSVLKWLPYQHKGFFAAAYSDMGQEFNVGGMLKSKKLTH